MKKVEHGELFFYYVPKGLFKKKPINVYEIPSKFNIEEKQYMKLVETLYSDIKDLRKEFEKIEPEIWSNLTISIQNLKFKVEYDYTNLEYSNFSSYERHVIWRYENLNIGPEQVGKEDKEIIKRYLLGEKTLARKEEYEAGIYIKDIENIIGYSTHDSEKAEEENIVIKNEIINKKLKKEEQKVEEEIIPKKTNRKYIIE